MPVIRTYIAAALITGIITGLFPGCVKQPSEVEFEDEIAVYGFLRGGMPLDSTAAILITRTQPLTSFYTLTGAAFSGGSVTITVVNTGETVSLGSDSAGSGLYYNSDLVIQPGYTYLLRIDAGDRQVRAETTVPGLLRVNSAFSEERVNDVYPDSLSRRVPLYLQYDDPEQVVVIDMNCRETWETAEYVNPFFGRKRPGSDDEFGAGEDTPPKHITAVGRFRELGDIDADGGCTVTWYSSMIVFYGSYSLQVAAIDDNYHRYLTRTTHPELEGGILGGIGVFGSLSGLRYELLVLKP